MKALTLKESCTQYSVTRNSHGDTQLTAVGSLLCLFRDISSMSEASHREGRSVTGTFWFPPDSTLKIGDAVGYSGTLYRIEAVTRAKALLTTDSVHFIKCTVSILRQIS